MKNKRMLRGIIGSAVVALAVFATAGTSLGRSACGCDSHRNTASPASWAPGSASPTSWAPEPAPPSSWVPRPVVMDRVFSGLQYRDGYPGHRLRKRQQVKKLQCMLNTLGYYAGAVDGWYGKTTARAVQLCLYINFQEDGCGDSVSLRHWRYLKRLVGFHCRKYNFR
jgi:hypothetical protein